MSLTYYVDGKWMDVSNARIPFSDAGFLLGDGLFETIRFQNGRLFKPDRHLARLRSGLEIIKIRLSKSDTDLLYVGTGEPNAGGGSLAYDGDGIYKSIDGGNTWQSKGLENVGSISKVIIDPTDDNKVFVGAMGPLFRNDNNRGVYRSEDGE